MASLRTALAPARWLPQRCSRAFATSASARNESSSNSSRVLMESLQAVPAQGSQTVPSRRETHAALSRITSGRRTATALGQATLQRTVADYNRLSSSEEYLSNAARRDYEQQVPRRWNVGDVYAPHDLSPAESRKWKKASSRRLRDVFDVAGINPLHEYKNFVLMGEFMTEMGRIKPRSETGLRPVNQRRLAKAIARAVGMGLMPSVHRHPEVLEAAKGLK